MRITQVGSEAISKSWKTPRSLGSGLAENRHAKAEVLAPREARQVAQPQMIHGVVLKGMVTKRLVPAVAPERGASSRDTMMPFPSAVGSV